MAAKNYILRSVYLEPELDSFLRHQAFTQNISKNDLIRRYLALGASVELGEDVVGLMNRAKPKESLRTITDDIQRSAHGANLAPLRITPQGMAVIKTSVNGTVVVTPSQLDALNGSIEIFGAPRPASKAVAKKTATTSKRKISTSNSSNSAPTRKVMPAQSRLKMKRAATKK